MQACCSFKAHLGLQLLFQSQVWYGGKLANEVNVNRMVAFVGQSDMHLPLVSRVPCGGAGHPHCVVRTQPWSRDRGSATPLLLGLNCAPNSCTRAQLAIT